MSRFVATISAWDCMDRIWITWSVAESEGAPQQPIVAVIGSSTTVLGTGEDDPREWLSDVLTAALESL